jgi:glyoxylase-like metal-dependent hydrolase (beta-lactamase superfamily II)/rhodanese-related sulfurtransferase
MSHATSGAAAASDATEVSAAELASVLGTTRAPVLVDVREPDEFEAWAIPGARNVPLSSLGRQLAAVEHDRRVVVVCASGQRSAKAAGALRAAGIDAANLVGGMLAWAGVYDTASMEVGPFAIVQIRRRGKGCLSYVVASDGEALVVDPPSDIERTLDVVSANGWRITRVVDTHLHADHVSGARTLAAATGAVLHLSPGDWLAFPFSPLRGDDRLELGHADVRVLATPGHTLGSVVLDLDGRALLTGDTLFVDGVGRPDLADRASEYAEELYRSLEKLLSDRPDGVLVLPAHYGDSVEVVPDLVVAASLGDVRSAVPQLAWERDRFVAWASTRATARPPSYVEIVRLNAGETTASLEEVQALELGPNRCSAA